jgi:hypothetical protein
MTQPKKREPRPPLEDQVLSRMLAMPPDPKVAAKKPKPRKK